MKRPYLFAMIILAVGLGTVGFINISTSDPVESSNHVELKMSIYTVGYWQGVTNGRNNYDNREVFYNQAKADSIVYRRLLELWYE